MGTKLTHLEVPGCILFETNSLKGTGPTLRCLRVINEDAHGANHDLSVIFRGCGIEEEEFRRIIDVDPEGEFSVLIQH